MTEQLRGDLPPGKRPKPAALMRRLVEDLFAPLALTGSPELPSYVPADIVRVWDLGPIGYEGHCWRHHELEFYLAKLDGQSPWIGIVPAFGVAQLNRMLVASHKIENLRSRGGGGRRVSGYASYRFEYRAPTAATIAVIEDNFDRSGLICRCLALAVTGDRVCANPLWRSLYPEADGARDEC